MATKKPAPKTLTYPKPPQVKKAKQTSGTPADPEIADPEQFTSSEVPTPGTAAASAKAVEGTGHTAAPAAYTTEGIASMSQEALVASGLRVVQDEWYGQIEMGNPFQEAGKPFADANPDKYFRFLGDRMVKGRGTRGYQVFNDPSTGKPVIVAGMKLAFIPMRIKEEKEKRQEEKTNSLRRQTREQYREAAKKAQQDSGGIFMAIDGEITETQGHRKIAI